MKKYFVSSDIHGFHKEWMKALKEAGFDRDNTEHIIIVLGDLFDRGKEARKVYEFVKSLPEERVVLIKGNHELLYEELLEKHFPGQHDFHNGTVDTFCQIAGYKTEMLSRSYWHELGEEEPYERIVQTWKEIVKEVKASPITEWVCGPQWKYYYELGKYIFVHSFIPLKEIDSIYYANTIGHYYPEWRDETSKYMWEASMWGCPYMHYARGCFLEEEKKGKILVCGHWHTSDFYNELLYWDKPEKKLDVRKSNPIFISDQCPGLIGLDACTILTKKVNVLVLDDVQQ